MRARSEFRKRTAQCPECGEFFSPQGLAGHMRFKHDLESDEAADVLARVSVQGGVSERAKKTLELVQQLGELRDELQKLEKHGSDWDDQLPPVLNECKEALAEHELYLVNELRKLRGKPELVRRIKKSLFGTSEELVPAVEDEEEEED